MSRLTSPLSRLMQSLALVTACLALSTGSALAQTEAQAAGTAPEVAPEVAPETAPKQEQRWYRVEVILFENKHIDSALEEVWPTRLSLPDTAGVGTLYDPPPGFVFTNSSRLKLGGAKHRLAVSGRYKPLMHFGWTQQGLSKSRAIPLHIQGGLKFVAPVPRDPVPTPAITQAESNAAVSADSRVSTYGIAEEVPMVAAEVNQIDGTLTLSLGRYLHIHTDLIYRRLVQNNSLRTRGNPMAAGADFGDGTQVMSFRMNQHRKMRSRELHYLDHPMFGMLIEVTPVATDA